MAWYRFGGLDRSIKATKCSKMFWLASNSSSAINIYTEINGNMPRRTTDQGCNRLTATSRQTLCHRQTLCQLLGSEEATIGNLAFESRIKIGDTKCNTH